jgi:hypothetical protein
MAISRRRILVSTVAVVVVLGGIAGGVLFLGGKAGVGPLANGDDLAGHGGRSGPPPTCPLTGVDPEGSVPNRPALAVKVENIPSVRPQTGLSHADIIYEEPVEAGITRFIVVYQCDDAEKIEPIRSARLTDPAILRQFGHAVFAYAGGVPQVISAVGKAGLIDVNFIKAASAYHRDPARGAPHNLYASSADLYRAAHASEGAPEPMFTYGSPTEKGRKVHEVHLPFSSYSDVFWRWDSGPGVWLRSHGMVPHTYSDGTQVNAKNVVVQVVKVEKTSIHDVNGVVSPEVVSTGSGTAYVFRNGRMIKGTWTRKGLSDVTTFKDPKGNVIPLALGNTWVELLPDTISISTS